MRKIIIIAIVCILAVILVCIMLFIATFGGFNFLLSVPKPEIKYSEFPFRLTYEIDGKTKTIEDTIICEFDGFETVGESGKYRKWKSHLKSGDTDITLLDLSGKNEVNELGHTILELIFYWGNAEFYMGDIEDGRAKEAQDFKWIEYKYQTEEGQLGSSAYEEDEAWKKYRIRLIRWEVAPPIENNFK